MFNNIGKILVSFLMTFYQANSQLSLIYVMDFSSIFKVCGLFKGFLTEMEKQQLLLLKQYAEKSLFHKQQYLDMLHDLR